MKPQRQLILHDPDQGQYGDCYRTCIAVILHMDAAEVPHFMGYPAEQNDNGQGQKRARDWLRSEGLAFAAMGWPGDSFDRDGFLAMTSQLCPDAPVMISGLSRLGCNHCVVALNGEIVCDPSGNGIIGPGDDGLWTLEIISVGSNWHEARE